MKKELFTIEDARKRVGPRAFTTLVKPSGSACNLACRYCYYLDKAKLYGGNEPVMSKELLETYIMQFIQANDTPSVEFCWHGGEPLLLGVDFYKRAIKLQQKYAGGKEIHNSLQTNGTLVTEDWCRFFSDNNFLIGLSIDGPEDIHNAHRVNKGGRPTFNKVFSVAAMMSRMHVDFNTLSVVSHLSEGRGAEIYRFLRDDIGSSFMQFLPAVDWIDEGGTDGSKPEGTSTGAAGSGSCDNSGKAGGNPPDEADSGRKGNYVGWQASGIPAPWSVSGEGYGQFLCDIFDEWVRHDVGRRYVQIFDVTLAQWCGMPSGICTLGETCGEGLAVEHNGDVYPCDHFVSPEFKLGNITETSLGDLFDSEKRLKFALFKRNGLPSDCLKCKYFPYCHGGCPGHRAENRNALCSGLKMFFGHVAPAMDRMRDLLAADRAPADIMKEL